MSDLTSHERFGHETKPVRYQHRLQLHAYNNVQLAWSHSSMYITTGAMAGSLATLNAMCKSFVGPVFPGNSPFSRLGERLITKAPS